MIGMTLNMEKKGKSFVWNRAFPVFALLLLLIFSSCSHVKSGHFIQLTQKDSLKGLAKEFSLPELAIQSANPGKNFVSGEWIFIPLERGIWGGGLLDDGDMTYAYLKAGEFIWPVPGSRRISSEFGSRWGKTHEGIDIPAREGSHIVAANDGVVVYSGNGIGAYGNLTVLSHRYGFFSVYAHARKNYTTNGQKIHKGEVIAQVGTTGRSSGPHLHFEIRRNSNPINPGKLLSIK